MSTAATAQPVVNQRANIALLFCTFVIAVCGLVYELLAGTISSYLLGDSVYQFSIVIGLFMASMGVGAYLSRYVSENLSECFVAVQIAIGLAGGGSAFVLFYAFSHLDNYPIFLLLISTGIGVLVGLEIPLIIRLLRKHQVLKLNVSNVLTADYIGALFASLLFPIILVPQLGLVRTALLFGLLNVLVAGLAIYVFKDTLRAKPALFLASFAAFVALLLGMFYAERFSGFFESRIYSGEIVHSQSTPYQRIVVTRRGHAVSLFSNGALQFNSLDEYRYHESLVHPLMSMARRRSSVLIVGGGDGLALREVLKYRDVEQVRVVDIDAAMTNLFRRNPLLREINADAFRDPRVDVVNADAWSYLRDSKDFFDAVIIDLPDPHNIGLSKLYTRSFYALVAQHLSADGILVTQATSPLYAREAFWCIAATLATVPSPHALDETLHVRPYHTYVPSFGEWGFVLASLRPHRWEDVDVTVPARYLDENVMAGMVRFPADMARLETEINTMQSHRLTYYYEEGWSRWYR